MRILLAHNSSYFPPQGGGDKSNRLLMEALAARGHDVRVITRVEQFGPADHERFLAELASRHIESRVEAGVVLMQLGGVAVHTLTLESRLRIYFAAQIEAFDPDVILASTDDPAHLLLEPALAAARARVVFLVRATIAVPFGPDSSAQSTAKTERLRQVDGIVGVSESVAKYMREWGGMDAIHVPISLMEPKEHAAVGSFDNAFVTMVNPCAVKGISIFLALADRMPDVRFAAVPTWGTNLQDLAELKARPNITLIDPVDNIEDLLRLTRVMLVPSVWAEARSRMVLESMAGGVPVIASKIGGLPEAKMGVDYLIPVNVITHYQANLDSRLVPVADVPPQNIDPWQAALTRLVTDRTHYDQLSRESRAAALHYIDSLTAEPFERYLRKVLAQPRRERSVAPADRLSLDKRKLLALRMRQKAAVNPWFPEGATGRRLFCFPWAGGGTLIYRSWASHLGLSVCPAVFPGRETRHSEPFIHRMEILIAALADAISPLLDQPFAFFGHSMGAGIAFELTRELRRRGQRLPDALFVSAARAPHLRSSAAPEVSDSELLDQLRRLGGLPSEALHNPDWMRVAMPALLADTRLYRQYVYSPEPLLEVPIYAYGGAADPNLASGADLKAWEKETTGRFRLREFAGGHFYFHDHGSGFLDQLSRDHAEVMGASNSTSGS